MIRIIQGTSFKLLIFVLHHHLLDAITQLLNFLILLIYNPLHLFRFFIELAASHI